MISWDGIFLGDTHEIPYEVTREYYRLKKLNTSPADAYFIKSSGKNLKTKR